MEDTAEELEDLIQSCKQRLQDEEESISYYTRKRWEMVFLESKPPSPQICRQHGQPLGECCDGK